MDKANPLSISIVVKSLNIEKDPFRPHKNDEGVLGSEVSYLKAIGALMYLANCTRSDIEFNTNLLVNLAHLLYRYIETELRCISIS